MIEEKKYREENIKIRCKVGKRHETKVGKRHETNLLRSLRYLIDCDS